MFTLQKKGQASMTGQEVDTTRSRILYSCYVSRSREGEQFVNDHTFGYQIAGELTLNDGHEVHTFGPGEFRFLRRNQLIKFGKQPPEQGEFQSLSVFFDQELLHQVSLEYGYQAKPHTSNNAIMALKPNPLYKHYMDSLLPYDQLNQPGSQHLQRLKVKEAVLILLQTNPELADVLFDFSEPGKLDLEAFMNKNYHFNVQLSRFAYLTGRSLASFKRDFEKVFHTSPSRWLQQKRLQEAHYLIKEKGKAPSDVYLEVGFEDLSHFSFAFKKAFGISPSRV